MGIEIIPIASISVGIIVAIVLVVLVIAAVGAGSWASRNRRQISQHAWGHGRRGDSQAPGAEGSQSEPTSGQGERHPGHGGTMR